ncbi:DHH family phosphoesterase [Candidatus Azambacteria bacterium]|nr:DHH family phosphoesterase [Candidatus Azambacteria bacterium]
MKNSSFKEIEKIITGAKKILAVSHQAPDGDAIGSLAAFGFYLQKIKKPHYLLCVSGVPESLKFIPGAARIKSKHPKNPFDLIVGFDYGSKIQLGIESYLKKYPKIPILIFDHHLTADQAADFGIIDSSYTSAVELLYDYLKAINLKIDKKIAYALVVGILSDTGFFKYSNNSKSMETAADLTKRFNIKPVEIDNKLNGQLKIAAAKLLGEILSRVKHHHKGDFVYSWVERKDLKKHRLTTDDINENISILLKNLKDGRFSLFLTEKSEGKVRGSLRSRPDKNYNVAKLAMKLGGGGHKYAAGFRVKGTIDSALKLVAKYAKK